MLIFCPFMAKHLLFFCFSVAVFRVLFLFLLFAFNRPVFLLLFLQILSFYQCTSCIPFSPVSPSYPSLYIFFTLSHTTLQSFLHILSCVYFSLSPKQSIDHTYWHFPPGGQRHTYFSSFHVINGYFFFCFSY